MKMLRKIAIILAVLMMIFVIAGCGEKEQESYTGGGGVIFDPNQGDYVEPEKATAGPGVAIPGFGKLTIPPNVTDVTVDFYNPDANADRFYLTFEIRIPDDSEQGYESVYKSGLVEAGKHIQKITLERGFEEGEYDAYLFVQPYRANEHLTPVNNANLKFKLIVK